MNIASHLLATALLLPLFAGPALAQQSPDQQMPAVSEGATAPDDLCQRTNAAQAPSQPQSGPSIDRNRRSVKMFHWLAAGKSFRRP